MNPIVLEPKTDLVGPCDSSGQNWLPLPQMHDVNRPATPFPLAENKEKKTECECECLNDDDLRCNFSTTSRTCERRSSIIVNASKVSFERIYVE